MTAVFTVGHSTRSTEELIRLLAEAGVDLLVDVRTLPRSRTNPQFNAEALAPRLEGAGIAYRHCPTLGGLRGRQKRDTSSANTLWRSPGFRNYADYAATAPFARALHSLIALAQAHRCAIMCAEAPWWRCHRRIITDYLLIHDVRVEHILGPRRHEAAHVTPGAQRQADGTLAYTGACGPRLL